MYFKYNVKGKEVDFFYNKLTPFDADYVGTMSWNASRESNQYKEKITKIYKDEDNKMYFMYEGTKVMFDDYIAYTPAELLIKMQDKEDCVNSDRFVHTLLKHGIDSIHVMVRKKPMTSFSFGGISIGFDSYSFNEDKSTWDEIEYKITETEIHKLSDNYKVRLVPAHPEHVGVYSSEDYYIYDLFSLLCAENLGFKAVENKAA